MNFSSCVSTKMDKLLSFIARAVNIYMSLADSIMFLMEARDLFSACTNDERGNYACR